MVVRCRVVRSAGFFNSAQRVCFTPVAADQPAGVMVGDRHQVAVRLVMRDLVDPDPGDPASRSVLPVTSATTRSTMAVTLLQEVRSNSAVAAPEACAASQAQSPLAAPQIDRLDHGVLDTPSGLRGLGP